MVSPYVSLKCSLSYSIIMDRIVLGPHTYLLLANGVKMKKNKIKVSLSFCNKSILIYFLSLQWIFFSEKHATLKMYTDLLFTFHKQQAAQQSVKSTWRVVRQRWNSSLFTTIWNLNTICKMSNMLIYYFSSIRIVTAPSIRAQIEQTDRQTNRNNLQFWLN